MMESHKLLVSVILHEGIYVRAIKRQKNVFQELRGVKSHIINAK